MEVKVKKPQRPKIECGSCRKVFPSILDLQEHQRHDHHTASIGMTL